jgi:hypothetical protein
MRLSENLYFFFALPAFFAAFFLAAVLFHLRDSERRIAKLASSIVCIFISNKTIDWLKALQNGLNSRF